MDLKLLYDLQEVEAEQKDIQVQRQSSQAVLELKRIKRKFEEKKRIYLDLNSAAAQIKADLDAFPERIQQTELRLQEEQKAIYSSEITSARALAAREAQVAACQQKLSELSALHLAYMGEAQQKADQLDLIKKEMESLYREFRQKKAAALQQENVYQSRINALAEKQAALIEALCPEDLDWFRREEKSHSGRPISRMTANMVCGHCHRMVTSSLYKRVKGKNLCSCEHCGRILFIDD